MASLSQEEIFARLLLWKESILASSQKVGLFNSLFYKWSPWDYLSSLDGSTRLSVTLALIICSYILFCSVWRFGRMIVSFAAFLLQLVLVFCAVLIALQYRDNVSALLQQAAAKLEL